ncbi:MAG: ankyrin repeat domain-containing protein, partial [Alphaproteobacteria bacterium]|nr:ankyrin repeat domain-containing protein [Alphaproteobacteria bacterium]
TLEQKKEKDKIAEEDWDKTWGTIHFDKDTDEEIVDKAEELLNKGVDIDMAVIQNYNRTPLMCAVTTGKEKFVDYLISKGADVDKADSYGFTPLMVASVKGNTEIVQKLLDAKADVTKRRKGVSALDMAKKYGHDDIAKLLTDGVKKLSILTKTRFTGR